MPKDFPIAEAPHKCPRCHRKFMLLRSLRKHLKKVHGVTT